MNSSRFSLVLFLGILLTGLSILPSWDHDLSSRSTDDSWKNHPALAEPDGQSHRGDKMVAADISDPRVLSELSRRFRQTKDVQLVRSGGQTIVLGAEDFEKRQEYFLRLLDHYWFSKGRPLGMSWAQVEEIFGPMGTHGGKAYVSGGRDTLCLWFKNGRVSDAFYAMGY